MTDQLEIFAPEATRRFDTHAARFEMSERPWHGGIIVFDDAQATIQRWRISPEKPLLVQVEGKVPTEAQLEVCAVIWRNLSHYGFSLASFCEALLPHCQDILASSKELTPAE
jgi:hypothetical protein